MYLSIHLPIYYLSIHLSIHVGPQQSLGAHSFMKSRAFFPGWRAPAATACCRRRHRSQRCRSRPGNKNRVWQSVCTSTQIVFNICCFMYMYMYIYTFICIYIYVYTCMHAYMYTHYWHMHRYIRACKSCLHAYIHTYIRTYMHTYTHTYVRTYVHTYVFFSKACEFKSGSRVRFEGFRFGHSS